MLACRVLLSGFHISLFKLHIVTVFIVQASYCETVSGAACFFIVPGSYGRRGSFDPGVAIPAITGPVGRRRVLFPDFNYLPEIDSCGCLLEKTWRNSRTVCIFSTECNGHTIFSNFLLAS